MKKITIALSLATLLLAVAASAGVIHKLSVNIPFDFYVGDQTMPAGSYVVKHADATRSGTLAIENARPGGSAFVSTIPGKTIGAHARSQLIFHGYGKTYFLAEVQDGTTGQSRQLRRSKTELEMAKNIGKSPVRLALVIAPRR